MIPIPTKDLVYLGAIIALIVGFLLYRHSLILDGEQIAQAREVKAAAEQKARDDLIAKGTVNDLNQQIAALSNTALTAVPTPMRLCVTPRSVSARAAPGEAASPAPGAGGIRGVPEGSGTGIDVGQVMYDFAYSGAIVAAYRGALMKWALEESQPDSGQK
jgi:hypothetical protein